VVAKGRTGSGKTGAFAIPIIQKLLNAKKTAQEQCTRALVLAPTRELSKQMQEEFVKVTLLSLQIMGIPRGGGAATVFAPHPPALRALM
jgi:ATP-dependent RNA helicase DDX56/DBP9